MCGPEPPIPECMGHGTLVVCVGMRVCLSLSLADGGTYRVEGGKRYASTQL